MAISVGNSGLYRGLWIAFLVLVCVVLQTKSLVPRACIKLSPSLFATRREYVHVGLDFASMQNTVAKREGESFIA